MPKIFTPIDINTLEKEVQKDYFDRHSPVIECENSVHEGEKFKVKVRVGTDYKHPDDGDHFISFIQLWNRETLLAETRILPGSLGNKPEQAEIDFYIVPKVSMNLVAMSYCTKHGLWQSLPKEVTVIHKDTDCSNN
jgi:superoxide reductase